MTTLQIAPTQRIQKDWTSYAKENVEVKQINSCIYGFASELACLRLAQVYRSKWETTEVSYSQNLKTWFFRLDLEV